MSKKIEMPINTYLLSIIEKPIREKADIIIVLLETISLFLLGDIPEIMRDFGKIIINIDKMSRAVYELENKIFSIHFPFYFENAQSGYVIKYEDIVLNSQIVSELMTITLAIKNNEDIDSLFDKIVDIPKDIYRIFKHLFMSEYGYIRYDYDEEHYKEKMHPLNHLDINCMKSNQYKIGIERKIDVNEFIDILDLNTECYLLKKL